MDIKKLIEKQLSYDFNFNENDLAENKNIFKINYHLDGRRIYDSDNAFIKILGYKNKLFFLCENNQALELCKKKYENFNSAWFSEIGNLISLNDELKKYGQHIEDIHHFYSPISENADDIDLSGFNQFDFKYIYDDEILKFKGDNRFCEAFAFDEGHPDKIGIIAYDKSNNEIAGASGASADGTEIWQIGINVLKGYTGIGLGTVLVRLLKNEVLLKAKVPFYSTVESHIASQKIAIKSGFIPTWFEIYTEKD